MPHEGDGEGEGEREGEGEDEGKGDGAGGGEDEGEGTSHLNPAHLTDPTKQRPNMEPSALSQSPAT